jgi:hypothetical protein
VGSRSVGVSAFLAVLGWWLAGPTAHTPEQVDDVFQTLVAPGVQATIGVRPRVHPDPAGGSQAR